MWEETEQRGFVFFKQKYDNTAIFYGGCNANQSDIYSPKFNSFIEIKDLTKGARCGQFTDSTIDNIFAQKIKDSIICGIKTNIDDIKGFIESHYQKKQVKYFLCYFNNSFHLYTIKEFCNNFTFSIQYYYKKSGTRKVPKKDFDNVLNYSKYFYRTENDKIYCLNNNMNGEKFYIKEDEFFISKKTGEVRKCSKTKNITYLIEVKIKDD